MAPLLGLRIVAPPFEIPAMLEMMQFHSTRRTDAGLGWLRGKLRDLAAG
jgi:hypothetical protein